VGLALCESSFAVRGLGGPIRQKHRFSCRLIAWRLPEKQANRRRQKLYYEKIKKHGKEPQAERLAWYD
jgi:hypothetical protein